MLTNADRTRACPQAPPTESWGLTARLKNKRRKERQNIIYPSIFHPSPIYHHSSSIHPFISHPSSTWKVNTEVPYVQYHRDPLGPSSDQLITVSTAKFHHPTTRSGDPSETTSIIDQWAHLLNIKVRPSLCAWCRESERENISFELYIIHFHVNY